MKKAVVFGSAAIVISSFLAILEGVSAYIAIMAGLTIAACTFARFGRKYGGVAFTLAMISLIASAAALTTCKFDGSGLTPIPYAIDFFVFVFFFSGAFGMGSGPDDKDMILISLVISALMLLGAGCVTKWTFIVPVIAMNVYISFPAAKALLKKPRQA